MTMQDAVAKAKAEFQHERDRMIHALATTPDDRVNWSPSPTARTPIEQVVHAAEAVRHIHDTLDGRTYAVSTPGEADRRFREREQAIKTREEALDLLMKNGDAYLAWLDTLTPEQYASDVKMAFSLGMIPMTFALGIEANHLSFHTAQMIYIQTIYGDRDWHM